MQPSYYLIFIAVFINNIKFSLLLLNTHLLVGFTIGESVSHMNLRYLRKKQSKSSSSIFPIKLLKHPCEK